MKRRLLLPLVLLSLACASGCRSNETPAAKPSAGAAAAAKPAPAPATPEAAPTESCNADTKLDPKVAGSPGNLIPSAINPNGDSELAVRMRSMRDDLRSARDQILRGEAPPKFLASHTKIRCSWPTDPGARNPKFDEMAVSYLLSVEDLDRAKTVDDRKMAYGRVLNSCVSCHQNTCPGPIAAIKALEFPTE